MDKSEKRWHIALTDNPEMKMMKNPKKKKWVTMNFCVNEDEPICAEQCECDDLASLLRSVQQCEALIKRLSITEINRPYAFAVYKSSGKEDDSWRPSLRDAHPLWRARVIYAFVAGGRIHDFGEAQCLMTRVNSSHERLKTLAENHPEGWTVYAIPVHRFIRDSFFHGMFPPENLELMTEYGHGIFTPTGELKHDHDKELLLNRPGYHGAYLY